MLVNLKKVKLNKTFKDKNGKEKNIITYTITIGKKNVMIKPVFNDDYSLLDSFSDFEDKTKKD